MSTETKMPTPRTDAELADPKYIGCIINGRFIKYARHLEAELAAMQAERDRLQQWKDSMMAVESSWNEQLVGKLLGIEMGKPIKANIGVKVLELLGREMHLRNLLLEACDTLDLEGCVTLAEEYKKALSSPPPPVVTLAEHEAVKQELLERLADRCHGVVTQAARIDATWREDKQRMAEVMRGRIAYLVERRKEAEQDAERLAAALAEWFPNEALGCDCSACKALAAHEARKGGK